MPGGGEVKYAKWKAQREEYRAFAQLCKSEVGHCEVCGHDPRKVQPGWVEWSLQLHHIARGVHRGKALTKRFAVLIVCYRCHEDRVSNKALWPEARQLAALKKSRPEDYDLAAYNTIIGFSPWRITEEDVARWFESSSSADL